MLKKQKFLYRETSNINMSGVISQESLSILKFFKHGGVDTVWFQGIQMTTRKKLCAIKGLSEAKVDKIKEASTKLAGVNFNFLCIYFMNVTNTKGINYIRLKLN